VRVRAYEKRDSGNQPLGLAEKKNNQVDQQATENDVKTIDILYG
jgi:hypothetical protein